MKICDRCGKPIPFFPQQQAQFPYLTIKVLETRCGTLSDTSIDLCKDCQRSFFTDFLESNYPEGGTCLHQDDGAQCAPLRGLE